MEIHGKEQMHDAMLAFDADTGVFIVEREEEALLREGLGVTISEEAYDSLLDQINLWIGTRMERHFNATGVMVQRVEVEVEVRLS